MIDQSIAGIVTALAFFLGSHIVDMVAMINPSWDSSDHKKRINNVLAGAITAGVVVYQLATGTVAVAEIAVFAPAAFGIIFTAVDAGYRSRQGGLRRSKRKVDPGNYDDDYFDVVTQPSPPPAAPRTSPPHMPGGTYDH